ncbi:two-component sensor histidine kinase [Nocardioides baekrokdamisoli]|uniref:histidine kinase n=1 Tax=Nocardioides baekrokdamisoli TaxID=1804624 RepID=A0A3G9IY45_9ACTN|nr:two-component sensor histidine kinase [Nocardioides baekrokdamisoli]
MLSAVTVALAFAVAADRSTMTEGIARLRSQALDQLSAATATYEFADTLLDNAEVVGATDHPAAIPDGVVTAAAHNAAATYFDGTHMWAANAISDSDVLVVDIPADSLVAQRADLHHSLLLLGLVTSAIAVLGGWAVATSLTARLRRAARWVETGADGGPREADLGRDGDEVGELVAQIDRLSTTLRDRVRSEQAFTADVAHELRTPLTALVSAVELLPREGPEAGLVRRQVARLRVLVDQLLELARADQDQRSPVIEPVDVVALVAEIAAQIPAIAPDELVAPDEARMVLAEPQRLERIIVNLLANAHRHGAQPVSLEVSGGCVTVRDSGRGFPEEMLTAGPRRLHALGRSAGSGLGLALAQTYARQMGATLSLGNESGGVAVLTLPAVDLSQN